MIPDTLGAYRNGRNPYEAPGPRDFTAEEARMVEASERAAAILRLAVEQLAQLPPITSWRLLSRDDAVEVLTSLIERFDCAEERIRNDINEEAF